MGEGLYRFLKWTAIGLTVAWVGWAAWDNFLAGKEPGEYSYAAGERAFSDGHYEEALDNYDEALRLNPGLLPALAGRAQTLILLGRENEAVETFDELIAAEPDVAIHYANRGFLRSIESTDTTRISRISARRCRVSQFSATSFSSGSSCWPPLRRSMQSSSCLPSRSGASRAILNQKTAAGSFGSCCSPPESGA